VGPRLCIVYFGAPGSFSEEAARSHARAQDLEADFEPALDPCAALERLSSGTAQRVVLPVANSTGGLVRATLRALGCRPHELLGEVTLPVRFSLWGRAAAAPASLARVASHPQAFAQCAGFLGRELPRCELLPWNDTASAAAALAQGELGPDSAVLASEAAGSRHALVRLARDVQDRSDNRTFFGVFGRRVPGPGVD